MSSGLLETGNILAMAETGKSNHVSKALKLATFSMVDHLTSVANGSRNSTPRHLRQSSSKSSKKLFASKLTVRMSRSGCLKRIVSNCRCLSSSFSTNISLSKGLSATLTALAADPSINVFRSSSRWPRLMEPLPANTSMYIKLNGWFLRAVVYRSK